jgi:Zn-dependent protease
MLVAVPASASLWLLPPAAPDSLRVALAVLGPISALSAIVNLIPAGGLDGENAWRLFRRTKTKQAASPTRPGVLMWRERRRTKS